MIEDEKTKSVASNQVLQADPTLKSIQVTLTLQSNEQVSCHLDTNNLPFSEVKRQLILFKNALQWQIDDEKHCPLYLEENQTN